MLQAGRQLVKQQRPQRPFGCRSIIGVVQSLAKAAVTQALDKAILKAGTALLPGANNVVQGSGSAAKPGHFSPSSAPFPPSSSPALLNGAGSRGSSTSPLLPSTASPRHTHYGSLTGGGSGDLSADMQTWKALVDMPVVASADSVDTRDLYLVSNDMVDTLDLRCHPGASSLSDPFSLVSEDLNAMNASIREILGVDHPVLARVAQYFFSASGNSAAASSAAKANSGGGGKKMRPAMVLLMSRAVNDDAAAAASSSPSPSPSPSPSLPEGSSSPSSLSLLASQKRLAEITEMIHTASLLHDDVIDVADTRRGLQSVNSVFGNKLAILAGDFLLARASVCLARLRNIPVVELLSTVIEHLVKGEVMQMRQVIVQAQAQQTLQTQSQQGEDASASASAVSPVTRAAFAMYLRKSYYKTASLMANSCRAVVLLRGEHYSPKAADAAFRYGMHTGMAFQLVDDVLDFEGSAASVGKPVLNDIKQGLATGPVLFAAEQFPGTVLPCIERKFEAPGDVDLVLKHVAAADGVTATKRLAVAHGQAALNALNDLAPGPARTALAALVMRVLNREA